MTARSEDGSFVEQELEDDLTKLIVIDLNSEKRRVEYSAIPTVARMVGASDERGVPR